MVGVEGAPGRSQEALFHSFTQQTLLEARGATSGKVALTLITGVAPWTLCALGKPHFCARPKWEATSGPSGEHSPDPRNASRVGPGSQAHSHISRGRSGPCSHLWPSPWLLVGVNPRLRPWDVHALGTCRAPGPECLQRQGRANQHHAVPSPGRTKHRGLTATIPETAPIPMERAGWARRYLLIKGSED